LLEFGAFRAVKSEYQEMTNTEGLPETAGFSVIVIVSFRG